MTAPDSVIGRTEDEYERLIEQARSSGRAPSAERIRGMKPRANPENPDV